MTVDDGVFVVFSEILKDRFLGRRVSFFDEIPFVKPVGVRSRVGKKDQLGSTLFDVNPVPLRWDHQDAIDEGRAARDGVLARGLDHAQDARERIIEIETPAFIDVSPRPDAGKDPDDPDDQDQFRDGEALFFGLVLQRGFDLYPLVYRETRSEAIGQWRLKSRLVIFLLSSTPGWSKAFTP